MICVTLASAWPFSPIEFVAKEKLTEGLSLGRANPDDGASVPDELNSVQNTSSDGLLIALRAWNSAARQYLASHADEIAVEPVSVWRHIGEDRYAPTNYILKVKPEATERLKQLPSYVALDREVARSTDLAPMINQLVGTAQSYTKFTTWTLANIFMPDPTDISLGQELSVDDVYKRLQGHLKEHQIEYRTLFPMQGVSFDERVELAEDLVIEQFTPWEMARLLDLRMVPTIFHSETNIRPGDSFGLKKTYRLPLIVSAPDQIDVAEHQIDVAELGTAMPTMIAMQSFDDMTKLQHCLAVITHERIQFSGKAVLAENDGFLGISSSVMSSAIPVGWRRGTGVKISMDQCADLRAIWDCYSDNSFSQNKALGLAIRRLAFATQRNTVEDRLLDIFIAAEALYLTDAGDPKERGDLKYRLALRAAVWSEGSLTGWTKREVLNQMKRGYNARSALAHGGTPKDSDIKVKDSGVTLHELVQATEEILRAGIHKAIQQTAKQKRLSIDWDNLILPE